MKIIYVYDALCGWCYGFSPVITDIEKKYRDRFDFEVISGGMVTGDRIGSIGEVAPYIKWAYKDVEKATGVNFGNTFLNETLEKGEAIFTSIEPAIALSIFKDFKKEDNIAFAGALQKAIYYDGIEPLNLEAYGKIAQRFGLDSADFVSKMEDTYFKNLAYEDFKNAAAFGVRGFPTLIAEINEQYYQLANGYMPLESLETNLQELLKK